MKKLLDREENTFNKLRTVSIDKNTKISERRQIKYDNDYLEEPESAFSVDRLKKIIKKK